MKLYARTVVGLIVTIAGSSIIGALIVFVLATLVLPGERDPFEDGRALFNSILAAAYLMVALPLGTYLGIRSFGPARRWLRHADAETTPAIRHAVLSGPRRLTVIAGVLWSIASLMFALLDAFDSVPEGVLTFCIVAFGGVTTCSIVFLLAERVLRGAAARALAADDAAQHEGLGVAGRSVLTWLLATGVPVLGLVLLAITSLSNEDITTRTGLEIATMSLGAIVLVFGLLATVVAARATADPIVSVRQALAEVEKDNFDVTIPVYDGTEIGALQSGFNRMVTRLQERERLRDLFGRHVGEDVARAALEQGIELGGEVRHVAALFVDLVGSTQLAARRPPDEVVSLLNEFFEAVVEVVEAHGGSINKFQGDAALAIFGAPRPLDDPATCALKAARALADRLREEVSGLDAGVGVSGGEAFAGNVGAEHRFEFTVIGDPINEAARLTEVAKNYDRRVAASADLVEDADEEERARWHEAGEETLRGRDQPTRIFTPA